MNSDDITVLTMIGLIFGACILAMLDIHSGGAVQHTIRALAWAFLKAGRGR